MKRILTLCAIVVFVLFAKTTIVSAQEIKGWIAPLDLLTDDRWLRFFYEAVNAESIGDSAGYSINGNPRGAINLHISSKTGLIPLYEESMDVLRPAIGNPQNLPKFITNNSQLSEITFIYEVDFEAKYLKIVDFKIQNSQILSPAANTIIKQSIKSLFNINKQSEQQIPLWLKQMRGGRESVKLNKIIEMERGISIGTPPVNKSSSLLSRLAQSKIGGILGFGLRGFGYVGTYYQLKDFTEGTFEEQEVPPGSTLILPPKIKQPNLKPISNTIGLPSHFKVEGDRAYYFDPRKYDWVVAADPELARLIKKAVERRNEK